MPGSVKSGTSSQYRTVARNANVDETLFGNNGAGGRRVEQEIAIIGKDTVQVRKKTQQVRDGAEAVVIPASELARIKDNATLLTKQEEAQIKREQMLKDEERQKRSRDRKEKMIRLEEERKRNAMIADQGGEERAQRNGVLEKAKQALDEEMDDVKHMNQMMLYSKIVTIRDAQIQEKRYIQQEKEEEERQLDMMMEIERLKALKMYEEREKKRVTDQRRGAQVIIEQIKDRQAQRMKEEEHRDQERSFILKQIDALKEEEVEQGKAKRFAAKRLMDEVNEANAAATKIKEERLLAERLEEQKILEYQRAKEQREREREEELQRLADEKEAETARLRAAQEKMQDKAAEMDALRAKRAMEAAERAAREKEEAEQRRLDAIHAELHEARKQQQAEKERRLAEQAKFERDEFERIIQVQMQQEEAERQRQGEEHGLRIQHASEIRHQIAAREERALQERRDFLEEGNVIRAQIGAERKKLEKIKERKIAQLQKAGVPEKYWSELARKKISV